ncbi:ABC transporter substrate-binding protein [Streptomyces sp. JNUCC 64]
MRRPALLTGALSLVLTTVVTACGGGEPDDGNRDRITFLYSPYADYGAFFLAADKGYFEEQGVDVKLEPKGGSSGETYQLVSSGHVTAGGASWGAGLFNAVESGASLSVLGGVSRVPEEGRDPSPLMVAEKAGKEIREIADLKGKKIGVPGPGGFGTYSVARALAKGGLTLKDVELTNISPPDTGAAFASGSLDAAWTIEPLSTALEDKKVARRLSEHHAAGTELGAIVFNTAWAEDHEDEVVKFLTGYLKAARELADGGWKDPANQRIIAKYTDLPVDTLNRIGLTSSDPGAAIDWDSVREQERFFRAQGDLEFSGDADTRGAFREDLLERALAALDEEGS